MFSLARALILALPACLLSAPGFAQGTQPRETPAAPTAGMSGPSRPLSPADHDMMEGMEKMSRDMTAAPMTGDPDRDFVAMMIPHHQGAIDMARVELRYGKDPMLRRMARRIVASQAKEIAEMRRWRAEHQTGP